MSERSERADIAVRLSFPAGFMWGVATSSHQIEGSPGTRREDVWDRFSRRPGAIMDGTVAGDACDHLRRMAGDVAMMAGLGVRAYRFSISWARVAADGGWRATAAGLEPYRRLVGLLGEAGISASATLYHWDHPQALEDAGGWRNRDMASWFAEYTAGVADALAGSVAQWATLNEPWCTAFLGHAAGEHAPGRQAPAEAATVAHHLLLGHGLAVDALRAAGAASVGIALNPAPVLGDGSVDAPTLRRIDGTLNRLFLDPVLLGRYPTDVVDDLAAFAAPGLPIRDGDEAVIARPIDWLGVNYYNDHTFTLADPDPEGDLVATPHRPSPHVTAPEARPAHWDGEITGQHWPITPGGFERLLVRLRDDYGEALPPLFVTENGAAFDDPVVDGVCRDDRRIRYLDAHLRSVRQAIAAGVDVRGFYAWSLFDNFEWAWGFAQRFGLVHVDFETQVRTPKASAHWYADICRTNALNAPVR